MTDRIQLIMRILGLLLVLAGTLALLLVLYEIWGLYREPAGILTLAGSIEQATRIDHTLIGDAVARSSATDGAGPHTLSWFLAWILAISLLALFGRAASWSIRAGVRLLPSRGPVEGGRKQPEAEPHPQAELPQDYRPSHRLAQEPLQPPFRPSSQRVDASASRGRPSR